MQANPLYRPGAKIAYQLRYSWTGWPSAAIFTERPPQLLDEIREPWEQDGLRLLESAWNPDKIQLTFSTNPRVSPKHLAARAKGRLDHAFRVAHLEYPLRRKVSVRAIGENTTQDVQRYLANQVPSARFVDSRFAAWLERFSFEDPDVDLNEPIASAHGRYWYALHLVLVMAGRFPLRDEEAMKTIRNVVPRIACKHRHRLKRMSVMPDHVHMAMVGHFEQTPEEIALVYQNNLAYALGQKRIWQESYYIGTVGEYAMAAIR
jgi:REP element-mobilizing transposase RayT